MAIEVHPGNTTVSTTLAGAVAAVRDRFGIEDVIVVGDHGMLTKAHAKQFAEAGIGFVSALKSAQIRKLCETGAIQLSLLDETNLAEVSSDLYPGERLVVCRNPAVAAERERKRKELLAATETELAKVRRMTEGPRGSLRTAAAAKIAERAGRVVNKYKMAKHFELRAEDGSFTFERKADQIEAEARLDGLYVIRARCEEKRLPGSASLVRAYKQLKVAERAFGQIKGLLAALGTLCRNTVRIGAGGHTYSKLAEATSLQARALELLG